MAVHLVLEVGDGFQQFVSLMRCPLTQVPLHTYAHTDTAKKVKPPNKGRFGAIQFHLIMSFVEKMSSFEGSKGTKIIEILWDCKQCPLQRGSLVFP